MRNPKANSYISIYAYWRKLSLLSVLLDAAEASTQKSSEASPFAVDSQQLLLLVVKPPESAMESLAEPCLHQCPKNYPPYIAILA